jgi:hypothetical protein
MDRDLGDLQPRTLAPARSRAARDEAPREVAADTALRDDPNADRHGSAQGSQIPAMQNVALSAARPVPVATPSRPAAQPARRPAPDASASPAVVVAAAAPPATPAAYDRVLAFSDALAKCAPETFFSRIACEQRARIRYCDGVAQRLPQCADMLPRDHGQ